MKRIWMMYVGTKYSGKFVAANDESVARSLVFSESIRRGIDPGAVHLVPGPVLGSRVDEPIPF
jgi:hypothetical protein